MGQLGILRLLGIALGVVSAVTVAKNGFGFFLTDFLTELMRTADYWFTTVLRPLEPLVAWLFVLLKKWGLIEIPHPRDHWRQVLVLMSLLLSNYVRSAAHVALTGRTVFLTVWAALCALLGGVLAGMVQFADERIFYFPAAALCLFFLGVRCWNATFSSVSAWREFGFRGGLLLLATAFLVLLAIEASGGSGVLATVNDWVRQQNAAWLDLLPSPAMALFAVAVVMFGAALAVFGFGGPGRVAVVGADQDPGQAIGRNMLLVVAAAATVVGASRAWTELIGERDTTWDREMVQLKGGRFWLPTGSSARDREGRFVQVSPFRMSGTEVTYREFERFVDTSDYVVDGNCQEWTDTTGSSSFASDSSGKVRSWRDPGIPGYGPDHPVVCVSLHDARAYARWLRDKTGNNYVVPTEAQWEAGVQGEAETALPCNAGDLPFDWKLPDDEFCKFGNLGSPCADKFEGTAPVGSNEFRCVRSGLRDMIGNVWEWTEGCEGASCSLRVLRGGSWGDLPRLASIRLRIAATSRGIVIGFRVARTD